MNMPGIGRLEGAGELRNAPPAHLPCAACHPTRLVNYLRTRWLVVKRFSQQEVCLVDERVGQQLPAKK